MLMTPQLSGKQSCVEKTGQGWILGVFFIFLAADLAAIVWFLMGMQRTDPSLIAAGTFAGLGFSALAWLFLKLRCMKCRG